jgi:hypothetical protein
MIPMKKLFYLYIILIFFPVLSFGQNDMRKAYLDYRVVRGREKDIFLSYKGSPYENPDFSEALVYTLGNAAPQKAKLRYNSCFDEMEMVVEGKDEFQILGNENAIDSIRLNGILYKYLNYNLKGRKTKGYLEQLCSGKINLYAKRPRVIQEEKFPASGYEQYQPPTIVVDPELYFVQFESGPIDLLPSTAKKIISYFQDIGYDLAAFTKTEKLKYDDLSIAKLVAYCSNKEKIPSKK